ncbi:hypothetical protein SG34_031540 [Thalassomonas viridans]|uniref:Uncharacterized protein n=1 Tax=Thalassomonas viridans TaxID=137584 RepID=A0AAF0CE05_9GAMM|nr:hypothetical protein [Thalassomonas viridans]WDE08459.1 hypothetical protein SG34_031540 [Thalassomonas viridans]
MARSNDMPEFHSVKVFVTENTPTRRRHLPVTVDIPFAHGLTSCFINYSATKNLPLALEGGQAHV